ncbi:DNA primase [Lebetimonas natsushimae]|uniref:DNA primase n=1 Tax=Lebetimonas natsushimae TaxID=1936991 RepID=A0A292YGW2_9BACT|nr:DNA primase [Lebetimonas natsushimae]GAX88044.1 DNA primase [Lebetimonas natsushimae]
MIKPESIENLKSIIDIVDIIGNYLQLKKEGSNYKALCPFHSEKTPSFVVSPSKQIYHCFGCGASGDAIKFIMEIEKLSYPEAIEKLASMYNFKLDYTSSKSFVKLDILESVNNYYISNLYKNKTALEYLKQRGLKDSTIEKFSLGFAPQAQIQINYFKNAKLDFKALNELGVLVNGEYPRLIERITFPIFSSTNKIIAFGGRTITNHPAKYINFTNTKIFNKSKTLYGLNFAREHILRKKEVIIVEGYMDVIMLHQAGYNTTVATLGTALTIEHLPILKKLNAKINILYDSDTAGINAALKASKLLYKEFFEGRVILLESGKDPADIVKEGGNLDEFIKNGIEFKDFIISQTINKYNIKNAIAKQHCLNELKDYIKTLPDLLKEDFINTSAQMLQINPRLFYIRKTKEEINSVKKIDIAEAGIIKTLYENQNLMDEIVEYLSTDVFKTHREELQLVYAEEFNNPKLLDIVLRDDVKTLNYESLKNQIRKLLIPYYQEKVLKIKSDKNLTPNEKMHKLKILNLKLLKLKKGELVESDSTI